MTGWTLFLIILGVAFLTAQLFRLIDLIERPSRRPAAVRKTALRLFRAVPAILSHHAAFFLFPRSSQEKHKSSDISWMFWKS